LIVSVLLFVTGFELFQTAFHAILVPSTATASFKVIGIIAITLVIKQLLSRFSFILGDLIDSKALKADAAHHMSDVLATGLVVAALIASRFGIYYLDGIMGVFVALIIFYTAYLIAKEAVTPLLGGPPSRETLNAIEKLAKNHKGVSGIHDIIFHSYGSQCVISLHIEVSDKESVTKLHALSEEVEEAIAAEFGGVVIVHIDPINTEHPRYDKVKQAITRLIKGNSKIIGFHELRIVGEDPDKCNIVFDLATHEDVDGRESAYLIDSLKQDFNKSFPQMKVFIKAEPRYVYNL
ncbi:MAG: cation transporter, partial [Planctomycetes bacterium]|nr:cation transporter [Planctomycetota bacterium]